MIITSVGRKYSKSINTKNYGLPESWIKVEGSIEAQCESTDDALQVSNILYDAIKNEVIGNVNELIEKMRASLNPNKPAAPVAPIATAVATPPVQPIASITPSGEINIAAGPAELFPSASGQPVLGQDGRVEPSAAPSYVAGVPAVSGYAPRPL